MTKEQALERLRTRCSRAEYCSGQVEATLKKWLATSMREPANAKSPVSGGSTEQKAVKQSPALSSSFKEEDIPWVIRSLTDDHFVDDVRFANAFVRDKLRFNGWGKQKIIYRLRGLGLSSPIIAEAIAQNYDVNAETTELSENTKQGKKSEVYTEPLSNQILNKLLERKWKSFKKEEPVQSKKAKTVRFALGRGFEYEPIMACLDKIIQKYEEISNSSNQ